jgi:hypothetical protein
VGVNEVILTPPCILLYGESLMRYTVWCQNDFNVQGYLCTYVGLVEREDVGVAAHEPNRGRQRHSDAAACVFCTDNQ